MRNVVIGVQYASIAEGSIPGAVLAVVKDSKLVYLKAYGNKSVYPDTVAMTTNTVFDLASLTKVAHPDTLMSYINTVPRLFRPTTKYEYSCLGPCMQRRWCCGY